MKYSVSGANVSSLTHDLVIAPVFEDGDLSAPAAALDGPAQGAIRRVLEAGDFKGRPAETMLLSGLEGPVPRIVLAGLGKRGDANLKGLRRTAIAAAEAAGRTPAKSMAVLLALDPPEGVTTAAATRHVVECVQYATYRFDAFKSRPDGGEVMSLESCAVVVPETDEDAARDAVDTGQAIAAGVALARDLGNTPANVCTPTYLAETAQRIAADNSRMTCRVLEQADAEELGMGAFLSVAQGSRQPPKFIVMEYRGGGDAAPIVLVGKGITFDTGGICIKPAPAMDEMKWDMGGAAGVIGTMQSVALLNPSLNVVALVPTCENMPDGKATRPGDIVTAMDGQTIEILNTDAEGRLILCDAICYSRRFEPEVVIDVATLTGACVIALGEFYSGLMCNDDPLADALLGAGVKACDTAWRLPVDDDYGEVLKSNFADFANVGGRPGGAITAACFLHKFARDLRWAHLDIAGSAWKGGKAKGGTGRPVSLLVQYLLDRQTA